MPSFAEPIDELRHQQNLAEFKKRALALLAGDRGVQRARRGSEPVWERWLSRDEVRSFHEVGHAVVACAVGFIVYEISIVERRDIRVGTGYSDGVTAYSDAEERPPQRPYTEAASDEEQLRPLLYCLAGAVEENVPRTRQLLEDEVDAILEANWLRICTCASELCREKTLRQARIKELLSSATNPRTAEIGGGHDT